MKLPEAFSLGTYFSWKREAYRPLCTSPYYQTQNLQNEETKTIIPISTHLFF